MLDYKKKSVVNPIRKRQRIDPNEADSEEEKPPNRRKRESPPSKIKRRKVSSKWLNKKVKVYWGHYKVFYQGTVTEHDPRRSKAYKVFGFYYHY